ncbi:MAG: hypothetical protein [Caudoviricetes sp.]|nr:MAG: hypothetical protein [Caudoviricetes sp.]
MKLKKNISHLQKEKLQKKLIKKVNLYCSMKMELHSLLKMILFRMLKLEQVYNLTGIEYSIPVKFPLKHKDINYIENTIYYDFYIDHRFPIELKSNDVNFIQLYKL